MCDTNLSLYNSKISVTVDIWNQEPFLFTLNNTQQPNIQCLFFIYDHIFYKIKNKLVSIKPRQGWRTRSRWGGVCISVGLPTVMTALQRLSAGTCYGRRSRMTSSDEGGTSVRDDRSGEELGAARRDATVAAADARRRRPWQVHRPVSSTGAKLTRRRWWHHGGRSTEWNSSVSVCARSHWLDAFRRVDLFQNE